MADPATMPRGLRSPQMELCLNCAEYIYDQTQPCPHCGTADPSVPGGRYHAEGFRARDAFVRLVAAMEDAGVTLDMAALRRDMGR